MSSLLSKTLTLLPKLEIFVTLFIYTVLFRPIYTDRSWDTVTAGMVALDKIRRTSVHSLSDNDEKVVCREWQIFSLVHSFSGHSDFLGGGGGYTPRKVGWGCPAHFPKLLPYYYQNLRFLLPLSIYTVLFRCIYTDCSRDTVTAGIVVLHKL